MNARIPTNEGFTLVELLVAVAISGIVMASVYSSYYSQQKSYIAQEQVATMQQNLRNALFHLERDIRMAGYDPTMMAGAGIANAGSDTMQITMDLNGDGDTSDTNETITYSLYVSSGVTRLGKSSGGGPNSPVADNIEALNFVYLDGDRNVTSTLGSIRSIQVTLVATVGRGDPGYVNTDSFSNQQGTVILPARNDNLRRRALSTEIRCRNLGLH
ncbi:MAG: prepilin-type N-terminal cleavage/methylation domain-containing protein [Deltaproteobacteria bacterium]|nr:prepilin-type N-terminal cleavage/methylation domain-containing protein [Deltaproteobacteria bacterium]MBW2302210.1 prepilin-type N-terminal cleavage/methylation domain-containing protein [Deltaproteobacteria bacterium]